MQRIRMKQDGKGSPDGTTILAYKAGEEYPKPGFPLSDSLAKAFVDDLGWAEWVQAVQPDETKENPKKPTPKRNRKTKGAGK